MTSLKCSDYGFECDFIAHGNADSVAKEFGLHSESVHGIEYSHEVVVQIISRKKS